MGILEIRFWILYDCTASAAANARGGRKKKIEKNKDVLMREKKIKKEIEMRVVLPPPQL